MSAKSDPRDDVSGAKYFYRRSLSGRELLPMVGIGVAAGLAAFYVAFIVKQRTPLGTTTTSLAPRRSRTPAPRGR